MSAVCVCVCPLCNKRVNIQNINVHIDSNCRLFLQQNKTLTQTQSDLTQYFDKERQKQCKNETRNSRKRKREENEKDMDMDNKRIKLCITKESMDVDDDEKEKEEYEQFECKNKFCTSLLLADTNDMECIYFDQRIVGHKFCSNKTYKTYKLHRNDYHSKPHFYLDLLHEFDNAVDQNAIVVVKCDKWQKSVIGLGYLPQTMSEYFCALMKYENVQICAYKYFYLHDERDAIIRIHICVSPNNSNCKQIRNKINDLRVIINENKDRKDLYFNILSNILVSCLKKYAHLFEEKELDFLTKMVELADKNKNAVQLLSRVMLRKVKWFKTNSLSYHEIDNVENALFILVQHGILRQSQQCDISRDLLSCVDKKILIQISNKTGLKVKKNGKNCKQLIQSIMHQIETQQTIFGEKLSENTGFLKKCHKIIGEYVAMSAETMELLKKCQLLFYLSPHQSIQDSVMSVFGMRKYPKYKVFDGNQRDTLIFPTKHIFINYCNALQFRSEYDEIYALYIKNAKKTNESELIAKIEDCAKKVKELTALNMNNMDYLNSFVCVYRDIFIYSATLHRGVSDVMEKLNKKQHSNCCSIYQQLLSSQHYSYKRGKWFCRLALLLHHHLKQYALAYTLCNDALSDDYVCIAHRNEIIKRYRKLHKILHIKHKLKIATPKSFHFAFALDDGLHFIDPNTFKYIIIGGKAVNCESGEKSRFFGFDDSLVSVEHLVLQYFGEPENGGWSGIHCEGNVYKMIFTVFMWDIIFSDIPYVFQTKYQNAPLDINTEWFYLNRKQLIEKRVNALHAFSNQDIEQIVKEIYAQHYGENVLGIYWNRFDLNEFIDICKGIGGYGIGEICLLLAKNYRFWGSGLPDLLLWRKVKHSDEEFECKIVEVKGPRDHLSEKQNCWILYLDKYAKLDVCVAKIKEEF